MQSLIDGLICWLMDWWMGDADEPERGRLPRGPPDFFAEAS